MQEEMPDTISKELKTVQAEHDKYKCIFELAADAIFIGNSSGEFIEVNESAIKMTGYSRNELLAMKMSEIFSNKELSQNPLRYDLLQKGEIVKTEREMLKKDKSTLFIEMNSRMLPDGTLQAVVRDISSRVQLRRKLEENINRQKEIIDSVFDAIFIFKDGICVAHNIMVKELFGYSTEDAVGQQAIIWITPRERDRVKEKIFSEYEGSYESIGLHKNGSEFPIEIQAKMTNYDGQRARISVVRDITGRKKAEQDLLTIQKLESLGTLAGGLAHDLNNILTGLFGNLSLAKINLSQTTPALRFITRAEESLTRFTHITNKLLTFSKGGKPVVKPLKMSELITEMIAFDLAGSNVNPVVNPGGDLWNANVDEGQIQQVFSNLLINAKQAMPEGGNLYINLSNCDNRLGVTPNLPPGFFIKVEIQDEGHGIKPENIGNIFDPYFSTKTSGSGLGLASVYSIISQHGGGITASSEPGQGATFTVYLPASHEVNIEETRDVDTTQAIQSQHYKILVVDDDSVVAKVCQNLLKSLKCTVALAKNGSQAIQKYIDAYSSGSPFDIVILDLTIPGEAGGAETVKQLLDINREAFMIVSSGYSDNPVMANYRDYGFSAVLAKPYTIEKLTQVLKTVSSPGKG